MLNCGSVHSWLRERLSGERRPSGETLRLRTTFELRRGGSSRSCSPDSVRLALRRGGRGGASNLRPSLERDGERS